MKITATTAFLHKNNNCAPRQKKLQPFSGRGITVSPRTSRPSFVKSFIKSSLTFVVRNKILLQAKLIKIKPFSSNPEVRQIEQTLDQKGVNVRFKNRLQLAKIFERALDRIEKGGFELPKNFLLINKHIAEFSGTGGSTFNFGQKYKFITPVRIRENLHEIPQERFTKDYAQKKVSTKGPEHFILHEVGHWLHFHNDVDFATNKEIWMDAQHWLVRREVSIQAVQMNNGAEFVPEVFAGIVSGKKYSSYIMSLYVRLGGPLPKGKAIESFIENC